MMTEKEILDLVDKKFLVLIGKLQAQKQSVLEGEINALKGVVQSLIDGLARKRYYDDR